MWGYIIILLPKRPLSFQRIWKVGLSVLWLLSDNCVPEMLPPFVRRGRQVWFLHTHDQHLLLWFCYFSYSFWAQCGSRPPLSLDTESESPWPSWNSLVLFVRFLGKSGTLFAGKSWLPTMRIFARKQSVQLSCLLLYFGGGGEGDFQISHKRPPIKQSLFKFIICFSMCIELFPSQHTLKANVFSNK